MSLFHANAGQAEIIRTVQKDAYVTDELSQNISDILRLHSNRYWIKYNHLCKLIAELTYHGFASINNLQTLGEEYTGIIQVDSNYITLPNKCIQFISIVLEFGGEALFIKLLGLLKQQIDRNDEMLPGPKENISRLITQVEKLVPYVKALHRSFFYLKGGKYQISKRVTGINYVLVRHWLKEDHSIYGYKVLGVLSSLQFLLAIINYVKEFIKIRREEKSSKKLTRKRKISNDSGKKCVLCLETREDTSLTQCGHVFCWNCILEWLGQKAECPICREGLKISQTIYLKNYR